MGNFLERTISVSTSPRGWRISTITRLAAIAIIKDARKLGFELMMFETYRSQARQPEQFNQGATKLRASLLAVGITKLLAHEVETDMAIDQPQEMVLGNVDLQAEAVEQRLRTGVLRAERTLRV
jgi:hypothetical protein